jgi:hypothetical protein
LNVYRKIIQLAGFGTAALVFPMVGNAEPPVTNSAPVYLNSYCVVSPQKPFAFIPLKPGAVEPSGWLRDWALAARDGITGHLDERHTVFENGWKPGTIQAVGARPDGIGWPIEQSAYWLDGALGLGLVLHDEALLNKIKARLDPVVDGVNRAEPSFIYWRKDTPKGFESWAHSQLGRALVTYYAATGERRILDALVKAYSSYPVPMGHLRFDDVSGLCNVDAMLETYAFSGDQRILERVQAAVAAPEPAAVIRNWLSGKIEVGHSVIAYENIRLPALLYPWTGDEHYLQASLKALAWLDEQHTLPYGVSSAEEWVSGIGAFRKTETCAVVADLWTTTWLYRILGSRTYGDSIERMFFNAGAAPVSRDFQTMSYYQSPNRIRAGSLPGEQPRAPGVGGNLFGPLGYSNVLCCVGAINRVIPNYVMYMWMATPDHGLAATLYGPCSVSAQVGSGVPVKLNCQTAYPFEETIRMTVELAGETSFPLYLRIPEWCTAARIAVNGSGVDAAPDNHGFARIERKWSNSDVVELQFPMLPQVTRGFETEYPGSAAGTNYFSFEPKVMFEPRRLPYASVSCGPLLFALPIADLDPNTPAPGERWQYALDNDATQSGADITVERTAMPAKWNWPLVSPVTLKVPARTFDWHPTDTQPLPGAPVKGIKEECIRLVPYGCTRFRISMFPVTKKAWEKQ